MSKIPILVFTPQYKSVIWGGNRITQFKGIPSEDNNIGESWEISGIPGHESVVAEGKYKGYKLSDLLENNSLDIFGKSLTERFGSKFPLLIKFIDSSDDLSVQVHPDDTLAYKRHNCPGKTEMWISIDPLPDAYIYSGLKRSLTPEEYRNRIISNLIVEDLRKYSSERDEVYFLPAGRIHSIGKGNLILEIQETSDITYRIYDYDRKDAKGNPRQLHIEESIEAVNFKDIDGGDPTKIPQIKNKQTVLVDCNHFTTTAINVEQSYFLNLKERDSFTIVVVIEGEAILSSDYGEDFLLSKGQTALIPAWMTGVQINGNCKMITTYIVNEII